MESPAGKHSQEYELGDYNQVLHIRNGGDHPAPDAVAASDGRTGETPAPFGLSPVFGTMDSAAYTRPAPYQTHLREVWDKCQIVMGWPDGRCPAVQDNVEDEWMRHSPFGSPPARTSRHSSGRASMRTGARSTQE